MEKPRVLVLCGPSGVGKTSLAAAIARLHEDVYVSVSVTTRPPRTGEHDGGEYRFMTTDAFAEAEAAGEFLETATVFSKHRYGTPRKPVEDAIAQGRSVLLEIDVQGARAVKSALPESITIFVMPPSFQELERRLRDRGTERPEAVERRLAAARKELDEADEFDHKVVNDDLARAAGEVNRILMESE